MSAADGADLRVRGDGVDRRVLIVEDEGDFRELLVASVEACGWAVTPAENGQEALEVLDADNRYGVILLDLQMPVMSGWEFRALQRKTPGISHIPVLVMSAYGGPRAALLEATQAAGFLEKPFDLNKLMDQLEHIASSTARTGAS